MEREIVFLKYIWPCYPLFILELTADNSRGKWETFLVTAQTVNYLCCRYRLLVAAPPLVCCAHLAKRLRSQGVIANSVAKQNYRIVT